MAASINVKSPYCVPTRDQADALLLAFDPFLSPCLQSK